MTLDNHPPSVDESWERTCQLLGWDRAAVESTILSLRETPILANLSLVVEAASERQPRRDGPFQVRSVAVLYVSLAATARTVCVTYAPRFAVGDEGPGFAALLEGFAEAMVSGAAARELGAAKLPEELRPPILRIAAEMRLAAETVRAQLPSPPDSPKSKAPGARTPGAFRRASANLRAVCPASANLRGVPPTERSSPSGTPRT